MSDVGPAWMLAASVLALAASVAAQPAREQEPYPPAVTLSPHYNPKRGEIFRKRPLALELSSSLGGPYGVIGAALDYSTGPSFAIAAGGGLNARPLGPRAGIMGRIRPLILDTFSSGVEAGFSVGPYAAVEDCDQDRCDDWSWDAAVWGHIALFAGYRTEQGWLVRASAGASSLFNVAEGECTRCSAGATPSLGVTTIPYLAISVGFAPRL